MHLISDCSGRSFYGTLLYAVLNFLYHLAVTAIVRSTCVFPAGIGPASLPRRGSAKPLSYENLVGHEGIEPTLSEDGWFTATVRAMRNDPWSRHRDSNPDMKDTTLPLFL